MADGDNESPVNGFPKRAGTATFTAIDGKAAIGDGVWIDTAGLSKKAVEVEGIVTATVIITESTSPLANKPANTVHGHVIDTLTVDSLTVWESSARWVKVRISAWTAGTINAYLSANS